MKNIVDYLEGKKTYIVAFLAAVVALAVGMGWIDMNTAVMLYGLLGAGGTAALRSAIAKSSKTAKAKK